MKPKRLLIILVFTSCHVAPRLTVSKPVSNLQTGSAFYQLVAAANWKYRDSMAVENIQQGNMPPFLKKFVRINTSIINQQGKTIQAHYYVLPDYLSVGTKNDWARVPLTPMAAQQIADHFHCFLPTRKMVDDIYAQAKVKLEPEPMFAFRDSSPTMWHHHLMIEGARKQIKGLIAGIKKDVVITGALLRNNKKDRVAIYGWHRLDGKPIQPLYTGHVNWYTDYSHGIRLVYEKIWVDGKIMNYQDVLKDPILSRLLCDEQWCDMYRYEK